MNNTEQQFGALTNFNKVPNPLLWYTDSYKISHVKFETYGVSEIYSNITPRFDKYIAELTGEIWDKKYVVFGVQYTVMRLKMLFELGFFKREKLEVIQEMRDTLIPYIGTDKFDHFEALHDLGYLPIIIKALPEGTLAPVGTPFFTITNTHPDFEWLPNYLETFISAEIWKPLTVATVGRLFRVISNKFAMETQGNIDGTEFQNHDFSLRGQAGVDSAAIVGAAFLLSSCGTDNISSLLVCKEYFNSVNSSENFLAASVPASEHSVGTLGILTEQRRAVANAILQIQSENAGISLIEAERRYTRDNLTTRFPTGIFSNIADSFNYWAFVTEIVPSLKEEILARDGKMVVRGDSGDPVHIIAGYRVQEVTVDPAGNDILNWADAEETLGFDGTYPEVVLFKGEYKQLVWQEVNGKQCFDLKYITKAEAIGTIECLWETFGGTTNELGFRALDSHIGMIYGDGITLQRSQEILTRLKERKFISTSIVYGVGSFSLNMLSRDHLGIAIKATNAIVDINGVDVDTPIYKDPKTDQSKKSARGLLQVIGDPITGEVLGYKDMQTREEELQGLLEVVLKDSVFADGSLKTMFQIRDVLWG